MAPLSARTNPKQAWGGSLDSVKDIGLPAGAKMRNVGMSFLMPTKELVKEYDIPKILETMQQYAFQRRLRIKDAFRDFDQLRCGRCTRQQFIRGVNTVMASLPKDQMEALADHYTEEGVHVQRPQVIGYKRFVADVEEVFTVARLEKQPTRKVPRAGASLQQVFLPRTVGVDNEEDRVAEILEKISLLCKTRGIVFLSCFQDCDRSDSISLVTPRYSGKATAAQFRQHFPLIGDIDDADIRLLAKRYTTSAGDINYQAIDRDIKLAEEFVPAPSGQHAPSERVPQSPRSAAAGKRFSSDRKRRQRTLQDTRQAVDIMEKLKAIVSEKRLRLGDCFIDFDKLRKGVCSMSHVRTVFTVLGIELGCRDYNKLAELFCNEEHLFRYRDFCTAVCEIDQMNITSWDMELPPTPSTSRIDDRPGSRIRYKAPLDDVQQARLEELEIRIRTREQTRSLDLKRCFQDFDKVCTGHVTRTQFYRIMNMLHCELRPADADTICQAYCDTDNGQEFNYIDFVSSVRQRGSCAEVAAMAPLQRLSPKYFDRSGEWIRPFTPTEATGLMYPDCDYNKIAAWSKAFSQ